MTSPTREEQARMAVRRVKEKLSLLFSEEGEKQFYAAALQAASIELLVDLAREGQPQALDVLREHARRWRQDALTAGQSELPVPKALLWLLIENFIDGPARAKTGPKQSLLRRQAIATVVRQVHEVFGFPMYTQPDDRDNPNAPLSACRIAAQELGLKERTVEETLGKQPAAAPG